MYPDKDKLKFKLCLILHTVSIEKTYTTLKKNVLYNT